MSRGKTSVLVSLFLFLLSSWAVGLGDGLLRVGFYVEKVASLSNTVTSGRHKASQGKGGAGTEM